MKNHMRLKRMVTILALALSLSLAGEALAGVGVIGDTTRHYDAKAGEELRGTITVRNSGTTPVVVKAYRTDYLHFADGTSKYGTPGSVGRSNGGWLSVTPERLSLAGGTTAEFQYKVIVPDDPELMGSYWSMIMVQPDVVVREDQLEGGMTVRSLVRYAIQIITDVNGPGEAALKFPERILDFSGLEYRLLLTAENTGERFLDPEIQMEIYNQSGKRVKRVDGVRGRIYPGCSIRYALDLGILPSGSYQALLIADNGDDAIFAARYDLQLE